MELGEQALAMRIIESAAIEDGEFRRALREAADLGTTVAEHHPAGAVAVDQRIEQAFACGRRGIIEQGKQVGIVAEAGGEGRPLVGIERVAVLQAPGDFRQRREAFGFGDIGIEIVVTRRVEQAQAGEVAAAAKLFGRGGQEDQVRRVRGQRFDDAVFGAGRLRRPGQVVRLVGDDEIPAGLDHLGGAFAVAAEEADAGNDELFVLERIAARIAGLDRFAAFLVEQGERQVEAAQQFRPLMQRFRQQHEHAPDAPVAIRRARIMPASMVLPSPTSSASSTRSGRRATAVPRRATDGRRGRCGPTPVPRPANARPRRGAAGLRRKSKRSARSTRPAIRRSSARDMAWLSSSSAC